eukprot:snap_masked-scaffold_24-processed-gene-2.33-mRNA-1 protein AED:1.00 eAED:1.00 QI:0/-1/0/0/-1/1/1/0/90
MELFSSGPYLEKEAAEAENMVEDEVSDEEEHKAANAEVKEVVSSRAKENEASTLEKRIAEETSRIVSMKVKGLDSPKRDVPTGGANISID